MRLIKKIHFIDFLIPIVVLIYGCEGRERFYRPDLPEQICAVGIIDIDDSITYASYEFLGIPYDSTVVVRKIYFEKSFQPDYSDGSTDFFREFILRISDSKEDIFVHSINQPTRNIEVALPDNMQFMSGEKYFFHVNEMEASEISASCILPDLPPIPSLVSLKTGISILDLPKTGCYLSHYKTKYTRRTAEIEFSFKNYNPESYYAILLTGSQNDSSVNWTPGWGSNLLNFEIIETNTDGFFYSIRAYKTIRIYCKPIDAFNYAIAGKQHPVYAYFIDGSKIPGGECKLKILTDWDHIQFMSSFIKCLRIRILAIPKEAYLFYKSLYTYKVQADDPFSELVNINGNIIGGNGVIALCRSRELIVYTGQTGGNWDPYF